MRGLNGGRALAHSSGHSPGSVKSGHDPGFATAAPGFAYGTFGSDTYRIALAANSDFLAGTILIRSLAAIIYLSASCDYLFRSAQPG
jgi:hypothetical protein